VCPSAAAGAAGPRMKLAEGHTPHGVTPADAVRSDGSGSSPDFEPGARALREPVRTLRRRGARALAMGRVPRKTQARLVSRSSARPARLEW
jgi:hypothetical protein